MKALEKLEKQTKVFYEKLEAEADKKRHFSFQTVVFRIKCARKENYEEIQAGNILKG